MMGIRSNLLLALALAFSAPALAQGSNETRALIDRLNRLEAEFNILQRQVYRGEAPPASAAAGGQLEQGMPGNAANRLSARMDEFEGRLRDLTGRLEEAGYHIDQVQRRLDKLVGDVDFRLTQIERGLADGQAPAAANIPPGPGAEASPPNVSSPAAPSSAPPSQPGVLGQLQQTPGGASAPSAGAADAAPTATAALQAPKQDVSLPEGSPQEQYNFAWNLLRQGDYGEAEQAFSQFVSAHPDDGLASNAQYWLGETYYVRKDFEKAAGAFLQGYQKYPKSPKAPDSLVKLGMTLTNLDQKQEACAVFNQFSKEYPNASTPVKDLAGRERTRAGCKN